MLLFITNIIQDKFDIAHVKKANLIDVSITVNPKSSNTRLGRLKHSEDFRRGVYWRPVLKEGGVDKSFGFYFTWVQNKHTCKE